MPTKRRGCCAVPRTPASPTIPIAKPAANPERPTDRPAPKCTKPLRKEKVMNHNNNKKINYYIHFL